MKLLLLGAGFEQKIVIDHAHELGIQITAVDGDPNAYGLKFADKSFVADIKDVEMMCNIAKEENVDGVFTHAVEIPHIVAKIAQKLNLPGLDPEAAYNATNKLKRIECLKNAKVPCPSFTMASSKAEAIVKAKEIRLPLVLKPIDRGGARGVFKVEKYEDVPQYYEEAVTHSSTNIVLLEEYLEGPEISTEAIIVDGKIITTGFADRNYSHKEYFKPHFIENGHTIPSILSPALQKKVIQTTEKAIKALKINWGVAKGDVIIDDNEPKILEMAARTSGGRFCSDMVPLANGINILKPFIQMSLGLPIDKKFLKKKIDRAAAQRYFLPSPGKILSIKGLKECRNLPGVYDIYLKSDIKIGREIRTIKNHADRIGHVIASGITRNEAVENAERAINTVIFEVEN